jgi:hypothetical protein
MILENKESITDDNYYEDKEYITASMVKQALQGSKKQFDYAMQYSKESEAMLVGSAFHCMMLEPDKFSKLYAFEPAMDRRTKAGKEYILQWQEDNKDIPYHIPGKHEEMLLNMKDSLNNHPIYNSLIKSNGEREVIKLFELEESKCKSKIDYYDVDDNYIVDIKTCTSAKVDDIVESIKKYMYGIQAAFYLDGLRAHKFYFVFVEKKAPYDVVIIDFISLEDGRKAYKAGIRNINTFRDLDNKGEGNGNYYSMFNKILSM